MQRKRIMITEYVEKKFREYYSRNASKIIEPNKLKYREFGFILFKDKSMLRHKGFNTIDDLRNSLRTIVPSDAYYSAAYYSKPYEEMDKKGWLGSDLIFDIDADHLTSSCKEDHDKWSCEKCSFRSKGKAPEKCPKCHSPQIREEIWICEKCLENAKVETLKVLNMLEEDFGISEEEIIVNFSGNRGYHVHVTNEKIIHLDSDSRKEIVDYIIGLGLDMSLIGIPEGVEGVYHLLYMNNGIGWLKRMSSGIKKLLKDYSKQDLSNLRLPRRIVNKIMTMRKMSSDNLIADKAKFFSEFQKKDAEYLIETAKNTEAAVIDTVVTSDIHRLIRLPYTLNSKTGLKVMNVKDLSYFKPLEEAVAFNEEEETVYVWEVPKFKLGGKQYGPFHEEKVSLPEEASIFLICRGRAAPLLV